MVVAHLSCERIREQPKPLRACGQVCGQICGFISKAVKRRASARAAYLCRARELWPKCRLPSNLRHLPVRSYVRGARGGDEEVSGARATDLAGRESLRRTVLLEYLLC